MCIVGLRATHSDSPILCFTRLRLDTNLEIPTEITMTTEELQNEVIRLRKENLLLKQENDARKRDLDLIIENGKAEFRDAYKSYKDKQLAETLIVKSNDPASR